MTSTSQPRCYRNDDSRYYQELFRHCETPGEPDLWTSMLEAIPADCTCRWISRDLDTGWHHHDLNLTCPVHFPHRSQPAKE